MNTFADVRPGVPLVFPDDHGAHPRFRQEWWYFTGNLNTADGRQFGVQLTFFRFAHGVFDVYRDSSWSHRQSYMAHFAISDIQNEHLFAFEDYARGTLGLAGATPRPFAVWVNGWSARSDSTDDGRFDVRLHGKVDNVSIDIRAVTADAPLLQGDQGYSVKSSDGELASYYYSYPDLQADGEIRIDDETFDVSGKVWMDHEWSTSVIDKEQTGWDWFALRLDNGTRLMMFRVRGADNNNHFSYAYYIDADGQSRQFEGDAIQIQPTRLWTSRDTHASYPLGWRIGIADANLEIEVQAAYDNQELLLDFRYWEGVVNVAGHVDNAAVHGQGYMELTGY